MNSSFFSARPSEMLRLKIGRVLAQIRGGVHKSRVAGHGPDFRGFRSWVPGDNPARINYPASLKSSPDLDKLVVNTSYGEKRISVVVALDASRTMFVPPLKFKQAGDLFWLFALSTFRESDRFRAIIMLDDAFLDSGWVLSEAKLEEFLDEEVFEHRSGPQLPHGGNLISAIGDIGLKDASLVVISDFCGGWKEEIARLDQLEMDEDNIRGTFIAINEWADVDTCGYGIEAADPLTGRVLRMSDRDFLKAAELSRDFFAALERALVRHPISFTQVPLLQDPTALFCQSAFDLEMDAY